MPRHPVERRYYQPRIERLSREELLGLQWRRTKLLLEYVYATSPFYRQRFQKAGLTPDDIKTMEDFRRLPLMRKTDLLEDQAKNPPLGKAITVGEGKLAHIHTTSGTSGKGQQAMGLTASDVEYMAARARGFSWAGVGRGSLVALCTATSLGLMSGSDSMVQAFIRMGVNLLSLGITFSTEQKVEIMRRFSPHFIEGLSPRIQLVCKEMGVEPRAYFPRLEGVLAEATYPSVEEVRKAEELWDCWFHASYGCTEAKTSFAYTCEKGIVNNGRMGQYHIYEDLVLVEVLDPEAGRPVEYGEEGEAVLTTLVAEASPALRLALSDRVVYLPHNNCDCGRPFNGIEVGSIRRYDDMMKVRGMNLWPSAVDGALLPHPEVVEYQGRVWLSPDGREEITIALELRKGTPPEGRRHLLPLLAKELRDATGLRMNVEEASQPLPQFEYPRKPRRWRDERGGLRGG